MQLLRDDDDQLEIRVRADELILLYRLLADSIENETYSFLAILPEFERHEARALARRMAAILDRLDLSPRPE
jgi:hypothetical protein